MLKRLFQISVLLLTLFGSLRLYYNKQIGSVLDEYNGVEVYFNSIPFTSKGKSLAEDGYVFGEKYESLEFVKRYYYEHYGYRLPESVESIEELFDSSLEDGERNSKLGLIQYSNPSGYPIKEGDIVIFTSNFYNPDGHVAIVSKVGSKEIEIVQQNYWKSTRKVLDIEKKESLWYIEDERVVGRLQKKNMEGIE